MDHSLEEKPAPHVFVLLNDHPKAIVLLRAARKAAESLGQQWTAVFIETFTPVSHEHATQENMLRLFTLAEQLGGATMHIEAETLEAGVEQLLELEKERIGLIITGSIETRKWWERWFPSAADRVTRLLESRRIAFEKIPLLSATYRRTTREKLRWIHFSHICYALLSVMAAYVFAMFLRWMLPPALFKVNMQNIGLLFMIACAFSAGRFGLLPGLIASVASFFTVNYFFVAPYDVVSVLKLTSVTDMLNVFLFLSAAFLISLFASQTHGYAEKAAKRELSTHALFTLYRIAINAFTREQALEKLQHTLTRMLKMEVAFFMPNPSSGQLSEPNSPLTQALTKADRDALELCWREMKTTGIASPYNSNSSWRFEPMMAAGGEIGVLGIRPTSALQIDAWFGRFLSAIAEQTATVFEHIELERSMEAGRMSDERDKLRSMLLSSVSHDLKTPLASIIGALVIYRNQGKNLTPEKREVLIETALEESERLDNIINNILDMTRLESGTIEFRREWIDLQSVIQNVRKRYEHRLRQHKLTVQPYSSKIEVFMDAITMGQVMQNVLDNAVKYTPAGTAIEISFAMQDDARNFCCIIRDHGVGLPTENLGRIFDKYARLKKKDSKVAGTGLGLAIARAIMEAQKASITASNHPDGGAVFTLRFPEWRLVEEKQQPAMTA